MLQHRPQYPPSTPGFLNCQADYWSFKLLHQSLGRFCEVSFASANDLKTCPFPVTTASGSDARGGRLHLGQGKTRGEIIPLGHN